MLGRHISVVGCPWQGGGGAYPKVNVEVAGAAKLAVADLVGDAHLVIPVEGLVEALEAMGGQDNVVSGGGLGGDGGDEEGPRGGEEVHLGYGERNAD